jgi:tape measure domain-containing protein
MTQSGGQAAGIQLQVGLDLAYFRAQMQKISNIASSEFTSRLDVRFNKRTLDAELNNLQRAIKRRVYRVEIGGNLSTLPDQIESLRKQLASLEDTKIDVGVGAVKSLSPRDARRIKSDLRTTILDGAKKILIPVTVAPAIVSRDVTKFKQAAKEQLSGIFVGTSIKPSIFKKDVTDFTNAVKSKLSGITVSVKAELETASVRGGAKSRSDIDADVLRGLEMISEIGAQRMAQGAGGVTEPARREQLRQSLTSGGFDIGGLKDIGKQLGITGAGRFKNANNLIEKIVTDASIEMVKKYLDPQAVMRNPDRSGLGKVLDTFARGVFNMLGIDPASMLQQARQQRLPASINWQATVAPSQRPAIGPSSTGRLLPGAATPSALPSSPLRGLLPEKALSVAYREAIDKSLQAIISRLSAESKLPDEAGKLGPTIQQMRQQLFSSIHAAEVRVREIFDLVGDFDSRQKAAGQARLDKAVMDFVRGLEDITRRSMLRAGIRQANVADLGRTEQLMLPSRQPPLMLPPAGGTTAGVNRVRTSTGGFTGRGYEPPGGFPTDGPLGGRQGPATFIGAGSQMEKFKTGLDIAAASTRNFTASQIPLLGGIKNLTGEFGEATKQVLLYGTAYKGLAFITSLPGQVLNAAKSQQQYNNALKTATQDTGTYGKELLYVDNIQRAFGLDLETTRTGFTKLYASMAPTGFDSGSIEKLFTGISAATAALQLTPDKAERVIYAFGQMASKGQIMSEELKGQLGDVLPGALAIFAKAAGMSVKEFSKAMEDGAFVGGRFREVFAKVSDELMNRFGTGAAAAGKSLQGLINVVGGDFKRTLESFAPLANNVAQAVLGPLGGALNQLAKAAQIATGETGRLEKQISQAQKDVADLKLVPDVKPEQIQAAEKNVLALKIRQEELNEAYKDPAIKSQVENIQSFVNELGKVGNFAMNLASILQSTLGPAFGILGNNLTTVLNSLISLAVGFAAAKLAALAVMGTLNTMNAVVQAGGTISALAAAKHAILAAVFRVVGVQATGAQLATIGFGVAVKGLLASTGIGLLVVALTSAATAFMTLGDKAAEAARKAKQSIDSMTQAAASGNVALIDMEIATAKAEISDLDKAEKMIAGLKTRPGARGSVQIQKESVTPGVRAFLEQQGFTVPTTGSFAASELTQQLPGLRSAAQQKLSGGQLKRPLAVQRQEALGFNKPGAVPPSTEETEDQKTKRDNLAQYNSLQDQLAKDFTQYQIDLLDIEHQHKVSLMNVFYDLQESRANSHQKAAIRFQKELYNIVAEYQGAQLKAQAEIMKAQGSVAGGAPAAPVLPPPTGSAAGAYLQGNIGPTSTGPHFDVKKMGGGYFPRNYLDQYVQVNGRPLSAGTTVPGGTFAEHQKRGSHGWDYAFGEGRHAATLMGGAKWLEGKPTAHGEARRFQLPTGEKFQFLHGGFEGPGGARAAASAGAPGKVTADQARSAKSAQQTQLAIQKEKVSVTLKEVEAIKKMEVAMENYVASVVPVAEQDLQNRLLAQRIQLTTKIASPAILDAQIKYAEQEAAATESIRLFSAELDELSQKQKANGEVTAVEAARIDFLRQAIVRLKKDLPVSEIQLLTEAIDKQVESIIRQSHVRQLEAEDNRQVNRLIIEGMTRQEAEAKVAADRLRGDYAQALELTNESIKKMSADLEILNLRKAQGIALTKGETAEYDRLTKAIADAMAKKAEQEGMAPRVATAATALEQGVIVKPGDELQKGLADAGERLADLTNIEKQGVAAANAIGDAFGQAFKGVITGSMSAREALAGFFQGVADHFADMVAQMIAEYLKMQLIEGIKNILSLLAPAAGSLAGGLGVGLSSGFSAGSASAIDTGAAGWGAAFNTPLKFANGGIASGGFRAFANGGIVTGPTLGLVGEGRYNEAVIPLPDGKSVPVDLGGAMGNQITSNIVVNVSSDGKTSSSGAGSDSAGLGRKIEGAVKQVIVGELRPGGLLAGRR